jgi:ribosome modulation factor
MPKSTAGTGRRGRPPSPRPEKPNVTPATFNEAYDDLVEKLAAKAQTDSAVANAYKRWEGMGVDKKELKRAIADGKLDAATRLRMHEHHIRNMAWLGMPLGTQTAMDLGAPKDDEGSVISLKRKKAQVEQEGLAAGRAGASISSCPYTAGTESYQLWTNGWHQGQREIVSTLGGGAPAPRGRGRPRKTHDAADATPPLAASSSSSDESGPGEADGETDLDPVAGE